MDDKCCSGCLDPIVVDDPGTVVSDGWLYHLDCLRAVEAEERMWSRLTESEIDESLFASAPEPRS